MHVISVSVVFAQADKQWLETLNVQRGTSVLEAVEQSGLLEQVEALRSISKESLLLGVFSQKVAHDTLLVEGDRVEIYRPLKADPKEVRRQMAELGKTIGQQRSD